MALITRISRLFRADFHAVLDRIEEPDILLRQAVREMQEEVHQDEQSLKLLNHEHNQISRRLEEIHEVLEQIDDELDVCFASNKEDLARLLIRRKLEAQQRQTLLQNKKQALAANISELNNRLQENQTQLAAMQQKVELLAEQNSCAAQSEAWQVGGTEEAIVVRDEDIEIALLREMQRRANR